MRIAHHLLRSRSGIYHFRIKVPADLHAAVGRSIVKISLRTADHRAAQAYSCALSLHYAQAFAALRGVAVPKLPPSIEALRKGADDGQLQRYEIDIDPLTLRPTKVRTDGTPEDHLAALQTLGVVFAQALPQRPMATAGQVPPVPVKTAGLSLADAIRLYEEAEAPSLKPNTWSQRTRAFESLKTFLGPNTPVASISREMAGDWAHELITRVPAGKKKPMTKRTAGNCVSHAAQLFVFLSRRGKVEGANPVKGVVVLSKKEKDARRHAGFKWEPFGLEALKAIYTPANLERIRGEHVRWGIVLALYTGARVGEIAQLYVRDFFMEGTLPCVRLTTDSDGQSLKTEASHRIVPLHPDLVALGLWERVEALRAAGAERLFPDMRIDSKAGSGNAISKGFGYYLKQLAIKPQRANGRLGVHSLRKTVIQSLQASQLSGERRRAFVGHERGDADVHEADYMRPWSAEELASLFPGLKWAEWLDLAGVRKLLRNTSPVSRRGARSKSAV
ncbi:site-specific integrase [Tahibacter caeni]|uniref:site-specific integrase n=1 Tax=Tahibacter caeni TaxID=1453545 RepID=UPI002147FDC7|nr:site-specific integrase [Tahibacter caeni]